MGISAQAEGQDHSGGIWEHSKGGIGEAIREQIISHHKKRDVWEEMVIEKLTFEKGKTRKDNLLEYVSIP